MRFDFYTAGVRSALAHFVAHAPHVTATRHFIRREHYLRQKTGHGWGDKQPQQ